METDKHRSSPAELVRQFVKETFRLNGLFLVKGDQLTKETGLTSSLRLILGMLKDEDELSVPQMARNLGITRQSVRRTVNLLQKKGYVAFKDNPDHRRSKLVILTHAGQQIVNQCEPVYRAWAHQVGKELDPDQLTIAVRIMRQIRLKHQGQ